METKGKDKDREGEGRRESVKPHGCTWHSRKRLLVEPRKAPPLQEHLGSSAPGQGGQKTRRVCNRGRPGVREALVPSVPSPTLTEHPLCAELRGASVLCVTQCILPPSPRVCPWNLVC